MLLAQSAARGASRVGIRAAEMSSQAADAAGRRAGAQLWGGRFSGQTDPLMAKYNASIGFDRRLWREDIEGSIMYSRALLRSGLLTEEEQGMLEEGLRRVHGEWEASVFEVRPSDEDIHSANERRLTELIGPLGGKLHTGRSRNDQVATDVRLWLRRELASLRDDVAGLVAACAARAEEHIDVLMPGYTHLQPAQPVRFSHWLLSHAWAAKRDAERLSEVIAHCDECPLGSGALAGHPFGLDREALAADLGFAGGPTPNSMDAVSDRDTVVETLFACALGGTHLSRLAEDVVVFSSAEFGYLTVAEAFSTGSSLMPQKRNPDALELLRGKAGTQLGRLVGLLATLKGLPSAYNKDLQEDKPQLFDAVDSARDSYRIAARVVATLQLRPDRMRRGLVEGMLTTDLADYLVRKGVPFREAHHVAGKAVRLAEESDTVLSALPAAELGKLHSAFEEDVADVWDFEASVERRRSTGGTARSAVEEQISRLRAWLGDEEAPPTE